MKASTFNMSWKATWGFHCQEDKNFELNLCLLKKFCDRFIAKPVASGLHAAAILLLWEGWFLFRWLTKLIRSSNTEAIFIGPESDHWLCLSLTNWLTHCRLVNLIGVTLACEDTYSKLVEVVIVADISDEDRVGISLFQIGKLRFGHKA